MSTNIRDAKKASTIPPMEPGTYSAICCGVIDLGLQKTTFEGTERDVTKILLIWEFPDETIEINGEKKPRWMTKSYTFSVSEKANLRKDLKSWRGKDFTEQELDDFDIARVIEVPCTITISHTTRNGNTYANITAIGKIMKGMVVAPPKKRYYFDMDNSDTWRVFPELPEWIQRSINDSLTLKNKGMQIDRETGLIVNIGKPIEKNEQPDMYTEEDMSDEDLPF